MMIIIAAVAFVGLFCAWVIVPSLLKKRHQESAEVTTEE